MSVDELDAAAELAHSKQTAAKSAGPAEEIAAVEERLAKITNELRRRGL